MGKKIIYSCALTLCRLFCFSTAEAAVSEGGSYELLNSNISGGGQIMEGGEYFAKGAIGQNYSNDRGKTTADYTLRSGFYNPAYLTYQKKLAVNFSNSSLSLSVPPDSVDREVFDLYLNADINNSPNKQEILAANEKIKAEKGQIAEPLKVNEIYFMDEQSLYSGPLHNPGLLSFAVTDSNGDGNVDGSNPPIRLSSLRGYILDSEYDLWLKSYDTELKTSELKVNFKFLNSGIYSLLGQLEDSVKDVFAFPVPFRPNGPNKGTGPGQTGSEENGITFANIPQTGTIEIYTIDGRLVKKIEIPLGLSEPKIKWNARNSSGDRAASGVYIWRIASKGNSKTGKLMIIR